MNLVCRVIGKIANKSELAKAMSLLYTNLQTKYIRNVSNTASNSHGAELKYYDVSENEELVLRCDCPESLIRDTTSKHCFAAIVNEEAIVAISSLPGTKESMQNCILQ